MGNTCFVIFWHCIFITKLVVDSPVAREGEGFLVASGGGGIAIFLSFLGMENLFLGAGRHFY